MLLEFRGGKKYTIQRFLLLNRWSLEDGKTAVDYSIDWTLSGWVFFFLCVLFWLKFTCNVNCKKVSRLSACESSYVKVELIYVSKGFRGKVPYSGYTKFEVNKVRSGNQRSTTTNRCWMGFVWHSSMGQFLRMQWVYSMNNLKQGLLVQIIASSSVSNVSKLVCENIM